MFIAVLSDSPQEKTETTQAGAQAAHGPCQLDREFLERFSVVYNGHQISVVVPSQQVYDTILTSAQRGPNHEAVGCCEMGTCPVLGNHSITDIPWGPWVKLAGPKHSRMYISTCALYVLRGLRRPSRCYSH